MDLEKDVSKLQHHVSVLSKRNHGLQKEVDRLKKEEVAVTSEVASPERVEEPEPQVVAEPEEEVGVKDSEVAFVASAGVAGVRVASVAKHGGTESRVALEMDEGGGPSAIGVPVSEGKRRRVDDSSEEGEEINKVAVPFVLLGLAAMVPVGPGAERDRSMRDRERLVGHERRGKFARLREKIWSEGSRRREAGVRNGMGGDSFRTRGSYAHARKSGNMGVRHEGFVPY